MTREDDFIGQLEGYLDDYEGLTPLPEAIRDAVRAQLPTTRQIGSRPGPMTFLSMSMSIPGPARYGLAAAVIFVAAVLGAAIFNRAGNIGADPSPTPTSPVLIEPESREAAAPFTAGTYYVDSPFPLHLTFEIPQGWSAWGYTSKGSQINFNQGNGPGEVSFEIVDNITADPCTTQLLDPPVGPSVEELVTALSEMEGFEASAATDVAVDGFHGKQFTLTAPNADACQSLATWKTTTRQNGVGPGEVNEVRILEVDGVRLLICVAYTPPVPAKALSELRAVAESVQIHR
jgi:hypothetical protein